MQMRVMANVARRCRVVTAPRAIATVYMTCGFHSFSPRDLRFRNKLGRLSAQCYLTDKYWPPTMEMIDNEA